MQLHTITPTASTTHETHSSASNGPSTADAITTKPFYQKNKDAIELMVSLHHVPEDAVRARSVEATCCRDRWPSSIRTHTHTHLGSSIAQRSLYLGRSKDRQRIANHCVRVPHARFRPELTQRILSGWSTSSHNLNVPQAAQAMASEQSRKTLSQAEQRKALSQSRVAAKASFEAAAAGPEKQSARIVLIAARLAVERFNKANPPRASDQREATQQQRQAEKAAKQQQKQAEKAAKQQQKQAEKAAKQQQKQAEKAAKQQQKQAEKKAAAAASNNTGAGAGTRLKIDLAAVDQEIVFRHAETVGLRLASVASPTTLKQPRQELQQVQRSARHALDAAATDGAAARARDDLIGARLPSSTKYGKSRRYL